MMTLFTFRRQNSDFFLNCAPHPPPPRENAKATQNTKPKSQRAINSRKPRDQIIPHLGNHTKTNKSTCRKRFSCFFFFTARQTRNKMNHQKIPLTAPKQDQTAQCRLNWDPLSANPGRLIDVFTTFSRSLPDIKFPPGWQCLINQLFEASFLLRCL